MQRIFDGSWLQRRFILNKNTEIICIYLLSSDGWRDDPPDSVFAEHHPQDYFRESKHVAGAGSAEFGGLIWESAFPPGWITSIEQLM